MKDYLPGRGFIPKSTLPKSKPVRGMRKLKYKSGYDDPTPKKKPVRKKKATTRKKAAHTTTKTVSRPKKQLPKRKRGLFGWF